MVKSSCLDINAREFVPKNLILDDEAAASGDDVASTHSSNSLSASAKGKIFDENLIKIAISKIHFFQKEAIFWVNSRSNFAP